MNTRDTWPDTCGPCWGLQATARMTVKEQGGPEAPRQLPGGARDVRGAFVSRQRGTEPQRRADV